MADDQQRFAKRLKALRAARGLTQAALAAKAGLSLAFVGRLEIAQHDPSLTTLRAIAKALGVTVGQLADDQPKSKKGEPR
jgi:transcriptional regulator with XRE-family HTH domain